MFKKMEKIKKVKMPKTGTKFMDEFKDFALKGNVIDMAVGVVIGTAFGKIVTSLVSDIIMPVVSVLTGSIDFTNLKFVHQYELAGKAAEIIVPYGKFLQNVIDFVLIALSIFVVIKLLTKAKVSSAIKEKKKEPEVVEPTPEEKYREENLQLLKDIKNLLAKK